MGFTHYHYRKEIIPQDKFDKIVADFKKILPEVKKYCELAGPDGTGKPIINSSEILFNGKKHTKITVSKINWETTKSQNKIFNAILLNNYDKDLPARECDPDDGDHESMFFERKRALESYDKKHFEDKCFDFTKTARKPYDLAVTVFLVIIKYHLGDDIIITSDGGCPEWFDAFMMCEEHLGYGNNYLFDSEKNKGYKQLLLCSTK